MKTNKMQQVASCSRECPGCPGEERGERPTWGEARKGRREPRPRAGGRCRGRQEHPWWRAGRPRSARIGVSGKDSAAGGSGQRRPPRKGSCATSSAAGDSRGGKRPIPVVSPQTGVATRATKGQGEGCRVPRLRGRSRAPGAAARTAAAPWRPPRARGAFYGTGASLPAAPRRPCGLSSPGAREAACAPRKGLPGRPALTDASVRPQPQSPRRIRRDGGPSTLAARSQWGRRRRAGGAPRGAREGIPHTLGS